MSGHAGNPHPRLCRDSRAAAENATILGDIGTGLRPKAQRDRRSVQTEGAIEVRVGIGHDTHRLAEGRPLILGGLRIDHPRGLVGHSDADVVCHAVADALLGAAGLGDIGEHYPGHRPQWRGLDSTKLLAEVVDRVEQAGWRPVNCDVIIHAQEPKLGPHKPAIRANLARLLGLDEGAVNVKAKTGEHVGPVGRQEAIVLRGGRSDRDRTDRIRQMTELPNSHAAPRL